MNYQVTPMVAVINESTVVSERDAWRMAWSCKYQVRWQFGPLWKLAADVSLAPKGVALPPGTIILHLLDTSDEPGALGYHDENGNELAYARVFAKTAQENGSPVSEVLSHELLEVLADAHVNLTAYDSNRKRLQAYEVCDPCQGAYDIGAPQGITTGVAVSNFVLPNYFDPNTGNNEVTDYRGVLRGPFSLATTGYVSYTAMLPPKWEQQLGERANKGYIEADERVQRRLP